MNLIWPLTLILTLLLVCRAMSAPASDFPTFTVPGHDAEMKSVRELFWLHYPGAGPKATLWDEWLPYPSLWPAVDTDGMNQKFRDEWYTTLGGRIIDTDGYVATHQHQSIAHQLGWPFPYWMLSDEGFGWHFSFKDTVGTPWRPADLSKPEGFGLSGIVSEGLDEDGWKLVLREKGAILTLPAHKTSRLNCPLLQIRWRSKGLKGRQPYVEWTTGKASRFGPDRRMSFEPAAGDKTEYTMIPLYKHPAWDGKIAQLRIAFDNPGEASVNLQAVFSQYDTRHNINCQNFIRGCAHTFNFTGDLAFLRRNIARMRGALRYLMTEHQTLSRKVVYTDWVGHDGRSGIDYSSGKKVVRSGFAVGNNYWDILPFGNLDCYATIQYYDALQHSAALEQALLDHPEWNVPKDPQALDPVFLLKHAEAVKREGNRLFWNARAGRFAACVTVEGQKPDYGFTFLNLEAIYYDFATPEHARWIMDWMSGRRTVKGDTSQGADIYHWRFGPRATTKRNTDWYFWGWSAPESIPFGGQVQDGGAVLGFSYHDLMSHLKVEGPDSAWERLQEIIRWFDEVQAAGGYRKYYDGSREGSMQGSGTAGGLGLDMEFFESAMVPQIMLRGFMGFTPQAAGFRIDPRLPKDWPSLAIDRIRVRSTTLTIAATPGKIEIKAEKGGEALRVSVPDGWTTKDGLSEDGSAYSVDFGRTKSVTFVRG